MRFRKSRATEGVFDVKHGLFFGHIRGGSNGWCFDLKHGFILGHVRFLVHACVVR